MKKVISSIISIYMVASLVFSVCCANSADPWEYRTHRNGLLCMEYNETSETSGELVIYSPFCNWSDVFLLGITWEEFDDGIGWYTFSDGLDCFGEYNIHDITLESRIEESQGINP